MWLTNAPEITCRHIWKSSPIGGSSDASAGLQLRPGAMRETVKFLKIWGSGLIHHLLLGFSQSLCLSRLSGGRIMSPWLWHKVKDMDAGWVPIETCHTHDTQGWPQTALATLPSCKPLHFGSPRPRDATHLPEPQRLRTPRRDTESSPVHLLFSLGCLLLSLCLYIYVCVCVCVFFCLDLLPRPFFEDFLVLPKVGVLPAMSARPKR